MVKPDPTQDYYGILEVSEGADAEDIKKSYRKLALKWHPDRNHGNEAEASSKFQDISAAHEILTDDVLRKKYDLGRAKLLGKAAAAFKSPTSKAPEMPPRPSHYSSNFSTSPPQYARPQPTTNGYAAKSPSSGAQRYSQFTANRQSWGSFPSDYPQNRGSAANFARAWDQMKNAQSQTRATPPPQQQPQPATGMPRARPTRANTFETQRPPETSPNATPKERAGWSNSYPEKPAVPPNMSRTNTTRMPPKRNGFAPGMAGGDEPQAQGTSAYASVSRGDNPQASRPQAYPPHHHPAPPPPSRPPPAGPPPPTAQRPQPPRPTPANGFRSPPSDERLRTPYATSGGEKTVLSNDGGFYRTASTGANLHAGWTEQRSSRAGHQSPGSHDRHRSASPRMRSPNHNSRSYGSSSSESSDEEDVSERVKLRPQGFSAARQARSHQSPPKSAPHPSVTVEVEREPYDRTTPKQRSTWSEDTDGPRTYPARFAASVPGSRRGSSSEHHDGHPYPYQAARDSADRNPQSPLHTNPPWTNSSGASAPPLEKTQMWREKFGCEDEGSKRHFESPGSGESKSPRPNAGFYVPDSSESDSPSKSPTREFSKAEWHEKFAGDPSDYLGPKNFGTTTTEGRSSPQKGRSRTTVRSGPKANESKTNDTKQMNNLTSPDAAAKIPPPTTAPLPTPKPSPAKFSKEQWDEQFKEGSWAYPQPGASPLPKTTRRAPRSSRSMSANSRRPNVARAVPRPYIGEDSDSKPEDGPAGESESDSSSAGSAMDIDSNNTPPTKPRYSSSVPPVPGVQLKDSGTTSSPPSAMNMKELKDTAPLGPSERGLHGLAEDLGTNLPFQSGVSNVDPKNAAGPPRHRQLPPCPDPPPSPSRDRLTKHDFETYVSLMRPYMRNFTAWNDRVLKHFEARQAQCEAQPPDGWLASRGTDGFARYLNGVEEDARIRSHWNERWRDHEQALRVLGEVRRVAEMGKFLN